MEREIQLFPRKQLKIVAKIADKKQVSWPPTSATLPPLPLHRLFSTMSATVFNYFDNYPHTFSEIHRSTISQDLIMFRQPGPYLWPTGRSQG